MVIKAGRWQQLTKDEKMLMLYGLAMLQREKRKALARSLCK